MSISAVQVKELRDKTGAGMMDAKKALVENNGDMEAATDWLRTKGIAKAAKKAGRVASEGMVWAISVGSKGAMVEVNAETDFCAKNEKFIEFVKTLTQLVLDEGVTDVEELKVKTYPDSNVTVADKQIDLVATIGENIGVRRVAYLQENGGTIGSYVHMGGKIGVLTSFANVEGKEDVAKQISMHVAASNPQCLDRNSINSNVWAREKAIYEEQAKASGKPENVMIKIVEGRLNKFAEEVCLIDQAFVMDTDRKVGQVVSDVSEGAVVSNFVRFGLGDGIEKKEEDFAAEVAKTMGS